MEALQGEIASIYAKKDRNGPPSANQVASKDEPRCCMPCCLHPSGAPTHLSLSRPFCSRRT